ncbi:MFS transporter, DHA2 family, glioxin efflux transporter, partial [Lecanoromycetidae sp. Uapishka_2]
MDEKQDPTKADEQDNEKKMLEVPNAAVSGTGTQSGDGTPLPSSQNSTHGDPALAEKGLEPVEEPSPRDVHGIKWVFAVMAVLASTFLFALDNTIVADVQPAIVERFGEVNKLPWLSVAFLVAAAGTNLVWGKMYGQFDAKILYLINVFLFEVGSAICGASNSMSVLIFGRALCGLGGVGMYCGVMTLLSVTTTEHERPMYIALTGITWGLGTVLGPIVGGAFTDSSAGWRWAFYINLCIGAVFSPAFFFYLPRFDPRPGVPLKKRFAEIDCLGAIVIIGAFVSGVMAINFGGVVYAWNSGRIIGLFVTSGVLFILFGLQQTFTVLTNKERRIFPIEFLKSRTMLLLFASMSCAASATFIPIYFIPLFFQFVKNSSALGAGVHLLPLICVMVFTCIANGAIMSATGYYSPWFLAGGIFTVIGEALLYTISTSTSAESVYGYSVLAGIGAGAFIQASFSVAQAKVGAQLIPVAIGFITCAQVAGGTIALAIANAVFLNGATNRIAAVLPTAPRADIRAAVAGAGSAFIKNLDEKTRADVLNAIVQAMSRVWILGITAGALVTILSLLMRREKLFMKPGAAA